MSLGIPIRRGGTVAGRRAPQRRDEDDLIDLLGRVVRADDAWGLRGLRLEQLTDRERELVKFVFARARQRRALAELRSRTA